MMSEKIIKAAEFAKNAHESIDQRRKYSNEPYIVHPEAVAELVTTVTDDV
jgi:(p)ppGpp synthase/HD superfamily hydrolase